MFRLASNPWAILAVCAALAAGGTYLRVSGYNAGYAASQAKNEADRAKRQADQFEEARRLARIAREIEEDRRALDERQAEFQAEVSQDSAAPLRRATPADVRRLQKLFAD